VLKSSAKKTMASRVIEFDRVGVLNAGRRGSRLKLKILGGALPAQSRYGSDRKRRTPNQSSLERLVARCRSGSRFARRAEHVFQGDANDDASGPKGRTDRIILCAHP
jgi:hypothetical protein